MRHAPFSSPPPSSPVLPSSSPSAVIAQHALVIHAARAGSLEVFRADAVARCVQDLSSEVERLCAKVVRDEAPANDVGAWVRLGVQADSRGFANADSFRRWCRRREVPMRRVGKVLFVRAGDVDAVIDRGAKRREGVDKSAVDDAVAALTRSGRR